MSKVVNLFDPPDTDIPGSLRGLADWLEKNPDQASTVIVVTVDDDPEYFPNVYAWGDIEGKHEIVYNLELAKLGLLGPTEPERKLHG